MAENGTVTVTITREPAVISPEVQQERYELLRSLETIQTRKAASYFLRISGQQAIVQRVIDEDHAEALEENERHEVCSEALAHAQAGEWEFDGQNWLNTGDPTDQIED